MIKGEGTLIFGDDYDESTGSEGPRDGVVDTSNAKISQVVKVSHWFAKASMGSSVAGIISSEQTCQYL